MGDSFTPISRETRCPCEHLVLCTPLTRTTRALGHANNANPATSILAIAILCTCSVTLTRQPQVREFTFLLPNCPLATPYPPTPTYLQRLFARKKHLLKCVLIICILFVHYVLLSKKGNELSALNQIPGARSTFLVRNYLHLMSISKNKPRSSKEWREGKPL